MSRLRQAVWRIGSADAVTWLSFWLTSAALLIGSLAVTSSGISWAFRLGVQGLGQLVLWTPLVVARWMALRIGPERRTEVAVIVIGAFCIGAAARTYVVGLIFALTFGPEAALWGLRATGSFGTAGVVFAVTAYAVSSAREQRRRIQELQEVQVELERSFVEVRVGIEQRSEQSVARVRDILEGEMAQLTPSNAQGGVNTLERLARDVVRPLSHQLAEDVPTATAEEIRSSTQVSWIQVLDLAARPSPFNPPVVAVLLLVPALGAFGSFPAAAPRIALIPVAAFVVLALANRLPGSVFASTSLKVRGVVPFVTALACSLIVAAFASWMMTGQPAPLGIVLGAFYFTLILSLGVAVNSAMSAARERTIERLDAAATELKRNLALVNQVRWFQEKALSRALHGPVQTAVSAAALKLARALESDTVTPELLEQLRWDVARELDVLGDATRDSLSLEQGVHSIQATWEGVCTIDTVIETDVDQLLGGDAPLRACVIAVVTEAISNAIRHGKAQSVDLWIRADREVMAVIIEMTSLAGPGAELPATVGAGLGTRQLDECSTAWSLDVTAKGQQLVVVLPVRDGLVSVA